VRLSHSWILQRSNLKKQWFNLNGKWKAIPYSIDKLQDRGKFFNPNDEIYEGQVIGENSRSDDMSKRN
jgi:predicted membrane GTPase involved in stress response